MGRNLAPVVLVHHNYAGLKQFDVAQACFLARAGYVGLAEDLYVDIHLEGAEKEAYGVTRVGFEPSRPNPYQPEPTSPAPSRIILVYDSSSYGFG